MKDLNKIVEKVKEAFETAQDNYLNKVEEAAKHVSKEADVETAE